MREIFIFINFETENVNLLFSNKIYALLKRCIENEKYFQCQKKTFI
jgi:hypothetical protein